MHRKHHHAPAAREVAITENLEDGGMTHRSTRVFLFLSGLLLLGIGGAILLVPHAFHAGNGIVLGDDPSLLSEVRAPGGLLTASSILILLGTFRRHLRQPAMMLTVLIYGSFGLARLLGLVLDGIPSSGLMGSTVIELFVATIGLWILWRSGMTSDRPSRMLKPDPTGLPLGRTAGSAASTG